MKSLFGIAGGLLLLATGGNAQSQPDAFATGLPLGLEVLHWGMSVVDATSAEPDLKFSSQLRDASGSVTNPIVATRDFSYRTCQFWLAAYFYRDRLDRVSLNDESATADCRREIVDQLNARFAEGTRRLAYDDLAIGSGGVLRGQTTSVLYYHRYENVDVQIEPNDDISGRRAAEEPYSDCERIEAFVEPSSAASAEAPRLLSDPGLGCEYPQLATRLMETGVVRLLVHLGNPGSVGNASILAASRSTRINDAALRIVSSRLRFVPATLNGSNTQADIEVRLIFTIIHPISVVFPCRPGVPEPPPFQPRFACT